MNTNMKAGKIASAFITLLFLGSFYALPVGHAEFVPPSGWQSYEPVTFMETTGLARINEPVDVLFEPTFGNCSSVNEIRVIAPDGVTEIPSQVYDVFMDSGYITSCRVVFLANVSASSSVTYYIIYNNPSATAPVYDGLRLHTELVGNTYNVTALVAGVEKNYFRILWEHLVDLYSDGKRVCWPGGPSGWEFSQIYFASLWADGSDNPWFSGHDQLSVVESGPLFVDFNITQPMASDLWGMVFNYNVSTTYLVRVYYQPDLNPLVGYNMSLNFKQSDIVKNPVVVDFKFANSTSYEIYQDFTWKNLDQEVKTVSAKNDMPQTDFIWNATKPNGWFSYNGSIPGMPDKPAANIGLIPTNASGTNPFVNYAVNFTSTYSTTPQEPYYDHHCTTQLSAVTSGVEGDVIETKGFINTYTPVGNAEPTMSNTAIKLRSPLIRIDNTPPMISILSPEQLKHYPESNVSLTFAVDESTDWMGYSLDAQANVTILSNETLTSLVDGAYYVTVYANDTAGNMGASDTIWFYVDTTPPNITRVSQTPPRDNVLPEDEVRVDAEVSDNISGEQWLKVSLNYTTNNGTWFTTPMTHVEEGYTATIPQFPYCTIVTYIIIAEDNATNIITSEQLEYDTQYHVIPEFPSFLILPLFMIATLLTVVVYMRARKTF